MLGNGYSLPWQWLPGALSKEGKECCARLAMSALRMVQEIAGTSIRYLTSMSSVEYMTSIVTRKHKQVNKLLSDLFPKQ